MAEAASRQAWAHTSTLLAMLANVNRDAKRCPAFKPADFDPHCQRERPATIKVGIEALKVFVKGT